MTAATDKARFYLEQCIPELRELESKKIFEKTEIQAINGKRSDFEHKLNAPGSKPTDWARYIEYEFNLDLLRRKRAKRIGVKVTKHAGPRRIFPLLERATSKFHGDMDLWVQYLEYAKRQKAYKRIGTIMTKLVRLYPAKPELWVYGSRYAFSEQGDIEQARSYVQRGLRFCPTARALWIEYFKLEINYLAKLAARSRILGLEATNSTPAPEQAGEIDEDKIVLPDVTTDGMLPDLDDQDHRTRQALESLKQTPAMSGAIPIAIFDAARQKFSLPVFKDIAAEMFEYATTYDMSSRRTVLEHIAQALDAQDKDDALSRSVILRTPVDASVMNTSTFALAWAESLRQLSLMLKQEGSFTRNLHVLSAKWIASYLNVDDLDDDIRNALSVTLAQIITSYIGWIAQKACGLWDQGLADLPTEVETLVQVADATGRSSEASALVDAASKRWPENQSVAELVQLRPQS